MAEVLVYTVCELLCHDRYVIVFRVEVTDTFRYHRDAQLLYDTIHFDRITRNIYLIHNVWGEPDDAANRI